MWNEICKWAADGLYIHALRKCDKPSGLITEASINEYAYELIKDAGFLHRSGKRQYLSGVQKLYASANTRRYSDMCETPNLVSKCNNNSKFLMQPPIEDLTVIEEETKKCDVAQAKAEMRKTLGLRSYTDDTHLNTTEKVGG